jgi:hypothetical protein
MEQQRSSYQWAGLQYSCTVPCSAEVPEVMPVLRYSCCPSTTLRYSCCPSTTLQYSCCSTTPLQYSCCPGNLLQYSY